MVLNKSSRSEAIRMQLSMLFYNPNQFSSGSVNAPIRILVVDDTHETVQTLKTWLEPATFELIEAHTGEQGIEQARHANPDMIVVDLASAEMDGLNICREIRRFNRSLILLLSANGKPGIAEKALNEGVDDFLNKPINNSILVASIYKLARRARPDVELPRTNGV
jgi:two-component system, OmpR family, KDP operon response regulator KdpE